MEKVLVDFNKEDLRYGSVDKVKLNGIEANIIKLYKQEDFDYDSGNEYEITYIIDVDRKIDLNKHINIEINHIYYSDGKIKEMVIEENRGKLILVNEISTQNDNTKYTITIKSNTDSKYYKFVRTESEEL